MRSDQILAVPPFLVAPPKKESDNGLLIALTMSFKYIF